jgi:hypothetical protein
MNGISARQNSYVRVLEQGEDKVWTVAWFRRRFNEDVWQTVKVNIQPGVIALQIQTNLPVLSLSDFSVYSNVCNHNLYQTSTFEPGDAQTLITENAAVHIVKASDSGPEMPKVDTTTQSGDGHYLTTVSRDGSEQVRLFTPKLWKNVAFCLTMQVYMPDTNRDLLELRMLKSVDDSEEDDSDEDDSEVSEPFWTSQSLFAFEQNVIEEDLRRLNELAKAQSKRNDAASTDDVEEAKDDEFESEEEDTDAASPNASLNPISNQGKRRKRRQREQSNAKASNSEESESGWLDLGDDTGAPLPVLDNIYRDLNGWHSMKMTVRSKETAEIEMRIDRRSHGLPIAIDDFTLIPGSCHTDPSCDFDGIACPVTFASSSGHVLLLGTGRLNRPSKVKGFAAVSSPQEDKSYAYLDATEHLFFNRKGKLRAGWSQMNSDWLSPTGTVGACFELLYYVQKTDAGPVSLSIHKQDRTGQDRMKTITFADHQEIGWFKVSQSIVAMERFRIGVRMQWEGGQKYAPFIAFDSMKLSRSGTCLTAVELLEEEERANSAESTVPDFGCNFADDFCDWQNERWRLTKTDREELDFLPRYNEYGGE